MKRLKLDIQRFGGRGASSSITANSKRSNSKLKFNDVKKGDTIIANGYTMKTTGYKTEYGYALEGKKDGSTDTVLGYLQEDSKITSSLQIPFSKAKIVRK